MTWKDDLRMLPAPEPPEGLLSRILASRAAGGRGGLPVNASASARRILRYTAAAAAIVGVWWVGAKALESRAERRGRIPPSWVVGGAPLVPAPAFGQERAQPIRSPRYPLIAQIRPRRVHAGSWTYEGRTIADGVFTTSHGTPRTIIIAAGRFEGRRTWVVTSSTTFTDTVLVNPATLRPLRYTRPMRHTQLVQQYSRDSVAEVLHLAPPPKERERTLRGTALLPDSGLGPMLVSWSPYSLEVLAQALPLDGAWRGSVYSANWVTATPTIPAFTTLDLRVTGTERVTVPAGTFDCWRLEVREGEDKSVLWVSQDNGWLVMRRHTSSDGSGKWRTEWLNETQLVAADTLPTPPAP